MSGTPVGRLLHPVTNDSLLRPRSVTQIELHKGPTNRLNNWTIRSITASSNSAALGSRTYSATHTQCSSPLQHLLRFCYSNLSHPGYAVPYAVPSYVAVRAAYDAHPDRTPCLEGTRTEVLETILAWASYQAPPGDMAGPAAESARERPHVFWLNGLAGTGKTTVAYTVAQQCYAKGILGASFFCSRSVADCNDPLKIFPTIAYQLASFHPPYRDRLTEVLQKDPSLLYSSITRQFEELILKPLASLRDNFPLCIVVIDALDECSGQQVTSAALSTLLKYAKDLSPLLLFVTSRAESHMIVATFGAPGYRSASGQLLLHEVALELVTADIRHFLDTSLLEIWRRYGLPGSRPAEADIDTLSRLAGGLFFFSSDRTRELMQGGTSQAHHQIYNMSWKYAAFGVISG